MPKEKHNPAEEAAQEAIRRVYQCLAAGKSFRLEAGAGAGKTYSLILALNHLVADRGSDLQRQHQRIACITYTNVAVDEITSRTDHHPTIHCSTIHSFCWSLLQGFQPLLREELPELHDTWPTKIDEAGGVAKQRVIYNEIGIRSIDPEQISLHHDDILSLMVRLMENAKFRLLLRSQYPIIFIDEYQDTARSVVDTLTKHILDAEDGPLLGLFGDHWQKIYDQGCGAIAHRRLVEIGKHANFRSVAPIVACLNRMRPELTQNVTDPESTGQVVIYHTNDWAVERRTGAHHGGDLPAEHVESAINSTMQFLKHEEWDLAADKTKVLMLTHRAIAERQGYSTIERIFPYNDSYIKKQDKHIKYLVDVVEPACVAYEDGHFGKMFEAFGQRAARLDSAADKAAWAAELDALMDLRAKHSIGEVLNHLQKSERLLFPDNLARDEAILQNNPDGAEDESSSVTRLRQLKAVPYSEIIALAAYIDEKTPFSTKHGVKGAEYENVIVIFGRGWNKYDFNEFLERGNRCPSDAKKRTKYENNRNLFYVVCSRPKVRLAMLFTQQLSDHAMSTLRAWFGGASIHSMPMPGSEG